MNTTEFAAEQEQRRTRAAEVAEQCGTFLNPKLGAETAYHYGFMDGLEFGRRTYGPLAGIDFRDDAGTCQACGSKHRGTGCGCGDRP